MKTCNRSDFSFPSLKMGVMDLFDDALGSTRDYSDLKKGSWQVGSGFRIQGLGLFLFFGFVHRRSRKRLRLLGPQKDFGLLGCIGLGSGHQVGWH